MCVYTCVLRVRSRSFGQEISFVRKKDKKNTKKNWRLRIESTYVMCWVPIDRSNQEKNPSRCKIKDLAGHVKGRDQDDDLTQSTTLFCRRELLQNQKVKNKSGMRNNNAPGEYLSCAREQHKTPRRITHYWPLRAFSWARASLAARTRGASVDRSTHLFMKSCCYRS